MREDVDWASRERIDLLARYHLPDGVSVIFEAANLPAERLVSLTGLDNGWLKNS